MIWYVMVYSDARSSPNGTIFVAPHKSQVPYHLCDILFDVFKYFGVLFFGGKFVHSGILVFHLIQLHMTPCYFGS
jgi:hypothetical protein